jgi:uncharacterized protein YjaG (DUF416 family)
MNYFMVDESALKKELEKLPVRLKVAFAAACAERLLPTYATFSQKSGWGDTTHLSKILQQLWDDLIEPSITDNELQEMLQACIQLIPGEVGFFDIPERVSAEEAATAVALALRCRQNGDAQEAVWAARTLIDALDEFIIQRDKIDISTPDDYKPIIRDPILQAELARQRRDLNELLKAPKQDIDVIGRIRDRARIEAMIVFP